MLERLFPFKPSDSLLQKLNQIRNQSDSSLQRNELPLSRLIMPLGEKQLQCLKKQFEDMGKGITLVSFIKMMRQLLPHEENQKFRLIQGLIRLFSLADCQKSGKLYWQEFTNFLSEEALAFLCLEPQSKDNEWKEEDQSLRIRAIDKSVHSHSIIQVRYSGQHLYALDHLSNEIRTFTLKGIETDKKVRLQTDNKFAAEYLLDFAINVKMETSKYQGVIVGLTNRRKFQVWSRQKGQFLSLVHFYNSHLHIKIVYLPHHGLWATASAQHEVFFWRFTPDFLQQLIELQSEAAKFRYSQSSKLVQEALVARFEDHSDLVTSIIELKEPFCVATGSMDCIIKLWDVKRKKPIIDLTEGVHRLLCVAGLDYSEASGHMMLSYGFRQHISLWCPFKSRTRAFIGKLEGHKHNVQLCSFIQSSTNCVSIDQKNVIRVWDIRTRQAISCLIPGSKANIGGLTSSIQNSRVKVMLVISELNYVVLAGKRIYIFEHEQARAVDHQARLVDDIVDMAYLSSPRFVMLRKAELLLFCAKTGALIALRKYESKDVQFRMVRESPKFGNILMLDSTDTIHMVQAQKLTPLSTLTLPATPIKFIACPSLLLLTESSLIYLGEESFSTARLTSEVTIHRRARAMAVTRSNVIVACDTGHLVDWDGQSWGNQRPYGQIGTVFEVLVAGEKVVVGGETGVAVILEDGSIVVLKGCQNRITCLTITGSLQQNIVVGDHQGYSYFIKIESILQQQTQAQTLVQTQIQMQLSFKSLKSVQSCLSISQPQTNQINQFQNRRRITKGELIGVKTIQSHICLFFSRTEGVLVTQEETIGVLQHPARFTLKQWTFNPNFLQLKIKELLRAISVVQSIQGYSLAPERIEQIILQHFNADEQIPATGSFQVNDKKKYFQIGAKSYQETATLSCQQVQTPPELLAQSWPTQIKSAREQLDLLCAQLKDQAKSFKEQQLKDRLAAKMSKSILRQIMGKRPNHQERQSQKLFLNQKQKQHTRKSTVLMLPEHITTPISSKGTTCSSLKNAFYNLGEKCLDSMVSRIPVIEEDETLLDYKKRKDSTKIKGPLTRIKSALNSAVFRQAMAFQADSCFRGESSNYDLQQVSKIYEFRSLQPGKRFKQSESAARLFKRAGIKPARKKK